ncbi:hypothetical protein B9K00_08595 [Staphylococcus caprae]|nr:hypothetical protein [Staphylococcus caprae]PAK64084.1 hypothetical protein B9K00_08595 [Staphylococcus caprae]
MKRDNFYYLLVVVMLVGFGFLQFERGFFWAKEQNDILGDSEFYVALHHIMPIWVWGIFGMLFSIFIIISPFFLPKQKINNLFNIFLVIGGCGNSIFYFFMTSASVFNAINWLTPLQFATYTMINVVLAFFGGAEYVKRK